MSKIFISSYDQYSSPSIGKISSQPNNPVSKFALQVNSDAGINSWTIVLEGSLDGEKWDTIMTHTKADLGDGKVLWSGPNSYPSFYVRSKCTSLDLGTGHQIGVTWLGVP